MKFESILSTQLYLDSYLNISRTFNIDLRTFKEISKKYEYEILELERILSTRVIQK